LFLEKYNTYLPDKGSPCRKIILSRNFRSRREVIDAVNFLSNRLCQQAPGKLDYTDAEALNFGAVFDENAKEDITVGGEVEFHLIQTEDEDKNFTFENEGEEGRQADEGEEDEEMLDSIQCEARLVGRRILELMKPDENGRYFSVFDKAKTSTAGLNTGTL